MYDDNISEFLLEEKKQFKNLLNEYSDVFSKNDFDLMFVWDGAQN